MELPGCYIGLIQSPRRRKQRGKGRRFLLYKKKNYKKKGRKKKNSWIILDQVLSISAAVWVIVSSYVGVGFLYEN